MINNLKILTILSIFVFILTGYFCFSSSFAKNQTIANNNEEKDDKKTTIDTNNKDNNNNEDNEGKEEVSSKLSILNIVILIVILIIVIVVIVFIIINFNKTKFEFKYTKSKEDFAKENFCPLFFLINPSSLEEKNIIEKVEENEKCFFEALSKLIFHYGINNIDKVEISLSEANNGVDGVYTISFHMILDEIANFAAFSKDVSNEKANEIAESLSKTIDVDALNTAKTSIKNKYGEEFDSYLCSYLLYYLIEEIQKNIKEIENVKIHNYKSNQKKNYSTIFYINNENSFNKYDVDFEIMDKILKKLLKDKQLKNVEYECS